MAKLPTDRQLKQMIKQAGGVVEPAPKPPKQTEQQKLSRNLTQPGTNKAPEPQGVNRRTLEKLVDRLEQRLDNLVLNHVPGMATFTELLQSQLVCTRFAEAQQVRLTGAHGPLRLKDVKPPPGEDRETASGIIMGELNYYLRLYDNLQLKAKVS